MPLPSAVGHNNYAVNIYRHTDKTREALFSRVFAYFEELNYLFLHERYDSNRWA